MKAIFDFVGEWLKDFVKLLLQWVISIIPGVLIAGVGLYLSSKYNQNWIWNVTGTVALILTAILFTYNARNN